MSYEYKLYGDGVHDDTKAIQERIDSGVCEVVLPAPKQFYLISAPLELPSHFRLVLPRFAEIRLADNSNCVMIRNKMVRDHAKRLSDDVYESKVQAHLWSYVDDYSPDHPSCDIEICGGIWNCNNENQLPNPERGMSFDAREFYGCGMLFYNVKNFKICSLTVKNPSQYAITLDKVSYFTVRDITFDFNLGNPYPVNMDGVHLDGNCHYGVICDLKGTCYDDMVAINAHEGSRGPISNIDISNLYAEYCHSAVRLLSVSENEKVEKIRISNVYGNFYQYCVGITKFYRADTIGYFDDITIDHVHAAKAMPARKGDFQHPKETASSFALIYIQKNTVTDTLTIENLHRRENCLPRDTVYVENGAEVKRLIIDDATVRNQTGLPMTFLHNEGCIGYLSAKRIDVASDKLIDGNGSILITD